MKDKVVQKFKGVFFNPRSGLFLTFQLNPKELSFNKSTSYEEEAIVGWHTSLLHWSGAAPEKISFELFFDTREKTSGNILPFPGGGTLGTKAILQSFLYPAEVDLFKDDIKIKNFARFFSNSRFFAPPDLYFIYGLRWFKCKLESSPIRETGHDKDLTPVQMTADISLIVLEDGFFHKYNEIKRKSLALKQSVQNAVELPFDLSL